MTAAWPLAIVLFATTGAREDAAPTELTLTVADGSCADEDALLAAIARRVPGGVRRARGPARAVDVAIAPRAGAFVGRARIASRPGEGATTRTVTGASCAEVVDALGLVIALTLDEPPDAPSPAPPPTPTPRDAPPESTPPAVSAPLTRSPWSGVVGLAIGGAPVGGGALGGGLFVALEHRGQASLASIALTASQTSLDVTADPARATITWRLVAIDACPWRATLGAAWDVGPCAGVQVGALHVAPESVDDARALDRPWIAVTGGARLGWRPLELLRLAVAAGAVVPVTRDTFAIDPAITLFRAPPMAPIVEIAAGVRFP